MDNPMRQDPRMLLDEAARARVPCRVKPRRGGWLAARLVRVDPAGAVAVVEGPLRSGEDVMVWLSWRERSWTFDASVLRLGVPVPDRSQNGVLLGFIDHWRPAGAQPPSGLSVEVAGPSGSGIDLSGPRARLLELQVDQLVFVVDEDEPLRFVREGGVVLRFRHGERVHGGRGRVVGLERSEGGILYTVTVDEVDDGAAHREFVADWADPAGR